MDLGDLNSVQRAVGEINAILGSEKVDILCANAGISPSKYATSVQGFETAFAVNCLGHHALIMTLMKRQTLAQDARIVGTTGDIYCLSKDCKPDFRYRGRGIRAYCRSKLGNVWQYRQLAKRFPDLTVVLVHPGVVATELEGANTGISGFAKRMMMISPQLGAQASLIAATQPFLSGSYFHNIHGIMNLTSDDAGMDDEKSDHFWNQLENLTAKNR